MLPKSHQLHVSLKQIILAGRNDPELLKGVGWLILRWKVFQSFPTATANFGEDKIGNWRCFATRVRIKEGVLPPYEAVDDMCEIGLELIEVYDNNDPLGEWEDWGNPDLWSTTLSSWRRESPIAWDKVVGRKAFTSWRISYRKPEIKQLVRKDVEIPCMRLAKASNRWRYFATVEVCVNLANVSWWSWYSEGPNVISRFRVKSSHELNWCVLCCHWNHGKVSSSQTGLVRFCYCGHCL